MALKGPVLTRYDPCGLGLIHFDRFSDNYWRGIVHFGLYMNLVEAEMVIVFKNEVTVSAVSIFIFDIFCHGHLLSKLIGNLL